MKITKSQLKKIIKEELQDLFEEYLYDFRVTLYDKTTDEMVGKSERVDARDPSHAKTLVNTKMKEAGSNLRASNAYNLDIPRD